MRLKENVFGVACKGLVLTSAILASCGFASAEDTVKVHGSVLDNVGEPIVGASVVIAGSNIGTITNNDGSYVIEVPAEATLEVFFMGYAVKLEKVDGREEIKSILFDEVCELEMIALNDVEDK